MKLNIQAIQALGATVKSVSRDPDEGAYHMTPMFKEATKRGELTVTCEYCGYNFHETHYVRRTQGEPLLGEFYIFASGEVPIQAVFYNGRARVIWDDTSPLARYARKRFEQLYHSRTEEIGTIENLSGFTYVFEHGKEGWESLELKELSSNCFDSSYISTFETYDDFKEEVNARREVLDDAFSFDISPELDQLYFT